MMEGCGWVTGCRVARESWLGVAYRWRTGFYAPAHCAYVEDWFERGSPKKLPADSHLEKLPSEPFLRPFSRTSTHRQ